MKAIILTLLKSKQPKIILKEGEGVCLVTDQSKVWEHLKDLLVWGRAGAAEVDCIGCRSLLLLWRNFLIPLSRQN